MMQINYLPFNPDISFYQNDSDIKVSLDSLLLSFLSPLKNNYRILDVGTNNGIVPLIFYFRNKNVNLSAIEINNDAIEVAKKNFKKYNIAINLYNSDFKQWTKQNSQNKFNLIVCNPPYFKLNNVHIKADISKAKSRHEFNLTLEELIKYSAKILEQKGHFVVVIRAIRISETIALMKQYHIEPKIIYTFQPHINEDIYTIVIDGIFQGSVGCVIKSPIYCHEINDPKYSNALKNIITLKKEK